MESYSDALIDIYVKKTGKDKPTILKSIEKCAKITAITLDIELSEVYGSIYSEEYLKACLLEFNASAPQACSTLTLEECEKSCKCFILDNKCYSRVLFGFRKHKRFIGRIIVKQNEIKCIRAQGDKHVFVSSPSSKKNNKMRVLFPSSYVSLHRLNYTLRILPFV